MYETPDQRLVVAEGLAAMATTWPEGGEPAETVREHLIEKWQQLGTPANAFADAAEAVSRQPQPIDEPAEEAESLQAFQELLGLPNTEEQLLAALAARDLLQSLARDYS
ncbi:hypothetical protein [Gryllotalpicola sp.]|uniref:hypothetical protein n=1 Tax=Gryllotalpicola sp. TaxID=1932787 RepID=UPI0026147514|nr:hypothetical protein [Gryllotalpicola sp.]